MGMDRRTLFSASFVCLLPICVQLLCTATADNGGAAETPRYDRERAAVLTNRVELLKRKKRDAEKRYREAADKPDVSRQVLDELRAQINSAFKEILVASGGWRSFLYFPVFSESDARASIQASADFFGYDLVVPTNPASFSMWEETGTFVRVEMKTRWWRVTDSFFFPSLAEGRPLQWSGDGWLLPTPVDAVPPTAVRDRRKCKEAAEAIVRAIYVDLEGVELHAHEPEPVVVYHYQKKRHNPLIKDCRWVATVVVGKDGDVVGRGLLKLPEVSPSREDPEWEP